MNRGSSKQSLNPILLQTVWDKIQALPWINPEHHIPVRKIPKSAAAITGRFWSGSMNRHVVHESLLEKRVFQVVEGLSTVWRYLEQPFRIPVTGQNGDLQVYTPDLLLVLPPPPPPWRIPPILLEVKPAGKLLRWVHENEGKVRAAAAFAKDNGMIFRFVTEEEVRKQEPALIHWLQNRHRILVTNRFQYPILKMVTESGEITLMGLIRRFELQGISEMKIAETVCALVREGFLQMSQRTGSVLNASLRVRVPHHPFTPSTLTCHSTRRSYASS